jgi:hypothetical protein
VKVYAVWRLAAATVSAVVLVSAGATPANSYEIDSIDAPIDGGTVTIVTVEDRTEPIDRGASATVFALALPDDARCPGDSANDQWRVQSFIIPAADDPATLTYGVNDPDGEGHWSLYGTDTSPYINELTAPNTEAGQSAIIPDIRPLSFGVFPPGVLPDGRYTIGMACTYFRATGIYWDVDIVVTADADDKPGQMTWRLASASANAPSSGSGSGLRPSLIVAGLIATLACGLFVLRRRRLGTVLQLPVLPPAPHRPSHVRTINQEKQS